MHFIATTNSQKTVSRYTSFWNIIPNYVTDVFITSGFTLKNLFLYIQM